MSVQDRVKATIYIELLENNLISFFNFLPEHNIEDITFQQDNAPVHKAGITMDWFEQQRFEVMTWPANSPDMNSIEHLWPVLKRELFRQFPDTKDLPGGPNTIKRELARRLAIVWETIGRDVLEDLIQSMPRRVRALIDAEGWYTKY